MFSTMLHDIREVDSTVLFACLAMFAGAMAMGMVASSPTVTVGLYAALFAPYAGLVWRRGRLGRSELWWVAGTAVAVRGGLVVFEPALSDDIYRYVWDGRVAAAGINPFRYPPASEALASLRDASIWPAINHAEVPTIYPPVAQWLFELNAQIGGGVVGLKGWLVVLELAAAAVVVWWMRRARVDWSVIVPGLALYILNPLVFVEVAYSGHIDVLAWSLLVVGLVVWRYPSGRRGWRRCVCVAVLVGLSIGAKFLSLAVLPLLLFDASGATARNTWWVGIGRRLAVCVGAIGIVMLAYVPYAGVGAKVFGGFGTYAATWRSNDGGYRAMQAAAAANIRRAVDCSVAGDRRGRDGQNRRMPDHLQCQSGEVLVTLEGLNETFTAAGWTKRWRGETLPDTTWNAGGLAETMAKGIAIVVVGLVLLCALTLGVSPAAGLLAILVALYLFAPVVHPWYVAWLVPLSVLAGKRVGLVFSATVLVGYFAWWSAETGGEWHVPSWLVALEYLSVLVAGWWDVVEDAPGHSQTLKDSLARNGGG
jgi:hypothetical protein